MDGVASAQAQEGLADAELLAGMRAGNSAAFAGVTVLLSLATVRWWAAIL